MTVRGLVPRLAGKRGAYQAPPSRPINQPTGGSWTGPPVAVAEHPAVEPTVFAGSAGNVWPVAPASVVSVVASPPTTVPVTGAGKPASGGQVGFAGWLGRLGSLGGGLSDGVVAS